VFATQGLIETRRLVHPPGRLPGRQVERSVHMGVILDGGPSHTHASGSYPNHISGRGCGVETAEGGRVFSFDRMNDFM